MEFGIGLLCGVLFGGLVGFALLCCIVVGAKSEKE